MIAMLGGLIGCQREAEQLAARLGSDLDSLKRTASQFQRRLRVFFEEWDEPLISGIRWVEELVEIAGGDPIFPELHDKPLGKDRIVDPAAMIERNPDVIVASWCGKAVKQRTIVERAGWDRINAV